MPAPATPTIPVRILGSGSVLPGRAVTTAELCRQAYPERDPVTPADLAATIYWRFGLDHQSEIHDEAGRPYRLTEGRPITQIFG